MSVKEMQYEINKVKIKLATLHVEGRESSIEAVELVTALLALQDSLINSLNNQAVKWAA